MMRLVSNVNAFEPENVCFQNKGWCNLWCKIEYMLQDNQSWHSNVDDRTLDQNRTGHNRDPPRINHTIRHLIHLQQLQLDGDTEITSKRKNTFEFQKFK